jgi:hypothetical protein
MSPRVHAVVKHAQDEDPIPRLPVENDVSSLTLAPYPGTQIAPWTALLRLSTEAIETSLQLAEILHPLRNAPSLLREEPDLLEVALRGLG